MKRTDTEAFQCTAFNLFVTLLICLLQIPASISMAQYWSASFLTTGILRNRLESPPAYDTVGNAVAAWERDSATTVPVVMIASRTAYSTNWTIRNIRTSPAPDGTIDRSPVVVTDKSGQWLCVWSSNDSLANTSGSDYDILYSRSTDAGATWSAPNLLNSTGFSDIGYDAMPWVSMDEAGNCIAAWTSDNNPTDISATTSSYSTVWISRSINAGQTWTPAEPMDREPDESLTEPRLATDGTGSFGLVWAARTGIEPVGRVNFTYSSNAGVTWSQVSTLNSEVGSTVPVSGKSNPAIAGDGTGQWLVAWNSRELGNFNQTKTAIFIARTQTNGSTWLPAVNPTGALFASSDRVAPSVYTDGLGTWCVGFHRPPYDTGHLIVSRDFGTNWSFAPGFPSTALTYIPGYPEPPETTPYVWRKNQSEWEALHGKIGQVDPILHHGRFEIRYAITLIPVLPPVDEDWSPARSFVEGDLVYGTDPDITTDAGNTWVSVYTMSPSASNSDTEIAFSRSTNGGRDWTAPQVLNSDWQSDVLDDNTASIAASDGNIYLCSWARSDGKIWVTRSLDRGQTWFAPQIVTLAGGAQVIGSQPCITSLGSGRWLLVWQADAIYSSMSVDDGLNWSNSVFVQDDISLGVCGNTSPCSAHGISGPRAFSAHGSLTAFVGFDHRYSERPFGYSGPINRWEGTNGHITLDGGATYQGNTGYSPIAGPSFAGSKEMAADGNGNWLMARCGRTDSSQPWSIQFGHSYNDGSTFSNTALANMAGRSFLWGKVAMDAAGHWFRFWAARQQVDLGKFPTTVLLSASANSGSTWAIETRLDTQNSFGANEPVDMRVKGGAQGAFVAVWQANRPTGEPTIWYSVNSKYNSPSALADWQLY